MLDIKCIPACCPHREYIRTQTLFVACCADSEYLTGFKHELPEHSPQRAETNAHNKNNGRVPGACSMIHVMQAVGAPDTHTLFVRVGFCPLFDAEKAFCCDVFTDS